MVYSVESIEVPQVTCVFLDKNVSFIVLAGEAFLYLYTSTIREFMLC